jgi:LysM repeat protein
MVKRFMMWVSAAVVIVMAIGVNPVNALTPGTYVVQPGDTLFSIARRHGIGVGELASVNGLRWTSWVYIGQRLVVPGIEPAPGTGYVVKRGDTLYSVARRFGTSVWAIMQANSLLSTRIYAGQRLSIPGYQPTPVYGTVDGWQGSIVNLPAGSQHAYYFKRTDGQGYGIGAATDAAGSQLEAVRWTGEAIRVWGTLRTDVPSYAGRYIAVERLEIVSGEPSGSVNLTSLASVSASSFLRTDRYGQYQPWMAVDGALSTAWVEGVDGDGVGQSIVLSFPQTVELHSIVLDVGYDKSADVFAKNNRIKKATLVLSTGEQLTLDLADARGLQTISLARAPGRVETTYVKVVIDEVYPGSRYDDTCLAEIQVWGRAI